MLVYESRRGHGVFPRPLLEHTTVRSINLSHNKLNEIPPEINALKDLRFLNLSDNRLEALPPQIGELTNLEVLDLSGNNLKSLPRELGKLHNLKQLYVGSNNLTEIPLEVLLLLAHKLEIIEAGDNMGFVPIDASLVQTINIPGRGGWVVYTSTQYDDDTSSILGWSLMV